MSSRSDWPPSSPHINWSRKRIWSGLSIPGKKMVRLLDAEGLERGKELLRLYQTDDPSSVLLAVVSALHVVLSKGAFGPALRNLLTTEGEDEFGAVLTDIRDLLKLRFRANGLGPLSSEAMSKWLASTNWPQELERATTKWHSDGSLVVESAIVNFAISALDFLSIDGGQTVELSSALPRLRDLILDAEKSLHFIWHGNAVIFGRTHDEVVDELFKKKWCEP